MPLPKYAGGVRAGKITEIVPVEIEGIPGVCMRLVFGEHGTQATCIPTWCAQAKPQVGQYFVTDSNSARCIEQEEFDLMKESELG